MNRLDLQEQPPVPGGSDFYHLNYDRTMLDYIIIAACYVLMPFAFAIALIRLFTTHYKNYRKAANYNLLVHVFTGAFAEIAVIFILSGEMDLTELVLFLVFLAVIFLLPAFLIARVASKAKFNFSKLCTSYMGLIMDHKVRHIGTLSERTGQSESDVRRDLLYLKAQGILAPDVTFYEGRQAAGAAGGTPNPAHPGRAAVFGSAERQPSSGRPAESPPQLPKAVRCPGCGAQNTVHPGQPKACDYCGTALTYS